MKWDRKVNCIDREEIFEENLKKIIKLKVNTVCVIFPYNQKDLLIPDHKFWLEIAKMIEKNGFLICSKNALVKAKPLSPHLITVNEMVLLYWEEIIMYLKTNPKIEKIVIVSSDINVARIRRDLSIALKEHKFSIKTKIITVSPGFWKMIYKIRETIVFKLPIWLYRFLGSLSSQ